jgi:hypothetical protein
MPKKTSCLAALLLLLPLIVLSQTSSSGDKIDTNALIKETQQIDQRNGKIAVFWWIPPDFWEASAISSGTSPAEAKRIFAPLRGYNLFVVAVGGTGIGTINWHSEAEVRANVVLRDRSGNTYKPLDQVSADAQSLSNIIKPVFKNILGPMAEGLHLLFFPGTDNAGKEIANPRERSELSLVVANLMGPGNSAYTWRLPLTSLLPPKYCPVGKEKVDVNWKYCPWHGNKLDNDSTPASTPSPK